MPEIDQILFRKTSVETNVVFTPHLTPMDRGILSTIYVTPADRTNAEDIIKCWSDVYANEPFVRVANQPPTTKDVAFTNFCDLYASDCRGTIVITSVLDNLIKGASGAAVQNMNLMCGFAETTALL